MVADDAEIDEEIERQLEADARERNFLEQPPLDETDMNVSLNSPSYLKINLYIVFFKKNL